VRIISREAEEQITLAQAQYQCKVDTSGDPPESEHDDHLNDLIADVRMQVETYLGRAIVPTTVLAALDEFPEGNFALEGGPVTEIDSIVYTDTDGVEQTVDGSLYTLNLDGELARVVLSEDGVWPDTEDSISAVRITYVIGSNYPDDETINTLDGAIRRAMLLLIKFYFDGGEPPPQWYTSKQPGEQYMPPAVKMLLGPHILRRRFA
jgi:uncharacterized phiE125 gp8 family phage protein